MADDKGGETSTEESAPVQNMNPVQPAQADDETTSAESEALLAFIGAQPLSYQRAIQPMYDMLELRKDPVDPVIREAILWSMEQVRNNLEIKRAHNSIIGHETVEHLVFVPVCNMDKQKAENATATNQEEEVESTPINKIGQDERLKAAIATMDHKVPFMVSAIVDNSVGCAKQRGTLAVLYSAKSAGDEGRISLPINYDIVCRARNDVCELAFGQFFRLPLLVMGCRMPFFASMLTGQKTRYTTNTLTCAYEAIVSIAAFPHAYAKQTRNTLNADAYRAYMEKFDSELRAFERHWLQTFQTTFQKVSVTNTGFQNTSVGDHVNFKTSDLNTKTGLDVADFSRMARLFFRFLSSMTISYVRMHWAFAMDVYGYPNVYETHAYLGMEGNWGTQIDNLSKQERAAMISSQADANTWRKDERVAQKKKQETSSPGAFLVASVEDMKLADTFANLSVTDGLRSTPATFKIDGVTVGSETRLREVFADLYACAGADAADVAFCAREQNGVQLLQHIGRSCACVGVDNLFAYPEHFTLGDLFCCFTDFFNASLWNQRKNYAEFLVVEPAEEALLPLQEESV